MTQTLQTLNPSGGLFPVQLSVENLVVVNNLVTMGPPGDSFYEYLLKSWIQV